MPKNKPPSTRKSSKRVVVMADLHCGHRAGLTPPGWQLRPAEDAPPQRMKWVNLQRECWRWYIREVSRLRPVDILIVAGDCIDGTGHRSGGTELITTDRNAQIDMAIACITAVNGRGNKPPRILMVRGTDYHTGQLEDLEDLIAAHFGAKVGDHDWYDINGLVFDVKHHVAGSAIPHGRATGLLRDDLWNALWSDHDEQPRADILIRAHVHHHVAVSSIRRGRPCLSLILPALQGMGSRYGARRHSQHVDFGFVHFDITPQGTYSWQAHVAQIPAQKAHALPL